MSKTPAGLRILSRLKRLSEMLVADVVNYDIFLFLYMCVCDMCLCVICLISCVFLVLFFRTLIISLETNWRIFSTLFVGLLRAVCARLCVGNSRLTLWPSCTAAVNRDRSCSHSRWRHCFRFSCFMYIFHALARCSWEPRFAGLCRKPFPPFRFLRY